MATSSNQSLLLVLVAGSAAGLLGHIPTKLLVSYLWKRFYRIEGSEKSIGSKRIYNEVQIFVTVLGVIERGVYAGSWLIGKPEVIAVLLAIKAAPALREWGENKILGRAQFNIWLTGVLVSLISSILLAETVRLLFLV